MGDLPSTVRVEPFLPLGEILPTCDLVVSHGGSGTVIASLAFGVPQLVLAMGADQPDNADRCRDLDVGLALDPLSARPADIAEAATTVLRDPGYRNAAQRIAGEARSLPGSDHAADLLEAMAEHVPPIQKGSRQQG
jgi:UDP:flavonoid glycosyltransferase YjiC (YdhE family)